VALVEAQWWGEGSSGCVSGDGVDGWKRGTNRGIALPGEGGSESVEREAGANVRWRGRRGMLPFREGG
jgi:hypothetical protein